MNLWISHQIRISGSRVPLEGAVSSPTARTARSGFRLRIWLTYAGSTFSSKRYWIGISFAPCLSFCFKFAKFFCHRRRIASLFFSHFFAPFQPFGYVLTHCFFVVPVVQNGRINLFQGERDRK